MMIDHHYGEYTGAIAFPKQTPAPLVLIAHAWKGCNALMKQKCLEISKLGYVGFAMDLFGEGRVLASNEEALAAITPFIENPELFKERTDLALDSARKLPQVDSTQVFAIGFCFGGSCVLEYSRLGGALKGIVALHPVFDLARVKGVKQKKTPNYPATLKTPVLILFGDSDPLAPLEDMTDYLRQLKGDVQTHIFSNTMHAYTNPEANTPEQGLAYNALSDDRSWQLMKAFFATHRS